MVCVPAGRAGAAAAGAAPCRGRAGAGGPARCLPPRSLCNQFILLLLYNMILLRRYSVKSIHR